MINIQKHFQIGDRVRFNLSGICYKGNVQSVGNNLVTIKLDDGTIKADIPMGLVFWELMKPEPPHYPEGTPKNECY